MIGTKNNQRHAMSWLLMTMVVLTGGCEFDEGIDATESELVAPQFATDGGVGPEGPYRVQRDVEGPVTVGDLDGNGEGELYTGRNTGPNGRGGAAIFRGTGNGPSYSMIYGPIAGFHLTHLAAGDLDNDGRDELYIAGNEGVRATLYRYEIGTTALTRIFGPVRGDITAMAVGDPDGIGGDELYTAFLTCLEYYDYGDCEGAQESAKLYRSDNKHSLGRVVQQFPQYMIEGLALGNVDGSGADEIYMAVRNVRPWGSRLSERADSRLYLTRQTRSNGWLTSYQYLWNRTDARVLAMAAGDVNADGRDEVFIGLREAGRTDISRIDRNGTTRVWGHSTWWTPRGIAIGNVDGDAYDEVFTHFEPGNDSDATIIYRSDSTTGRLPGRRLPTPSVMAYSPVRPAGLPWATRSPFSPPSF